MAEWHSLTLPPDPLKTMVEDLGGAVGSIAEVLVTTLSVLKAALEVVRVFIMGAANLIRVLVDVAVALVEQLIADLTSAGMYLLMVAPRMEGWPDNTGVSGGIPGFFETVRRSIEDPYDPNRPQASSWSLVGGAIVLVSAPDIAMIIGAINTLLTLFGRGTALLPPPSGVTAGVVGLTGNPITDMGLLVESVSGRTPPVVVRWTPLVSLVRYRVERSRWPGGLPVIIKETSPRRYELRVATEPNEVQSLANNEDVARDPAGALVTSFDVVGDLDPLSSYLEDNSVDLGVTYYYRVRTYTDNPEMTVDDKGRIVWVGGQMGLPSPILPVTIPCVLPGFDISTALQRTLNAATNVGSTLLGASDQEAVALLRGGTDAYSALYENMVRGLTYRLVGRVDRIYANALTNLVRSRSMQETFRQKYEAAIEPIWRWCGPGTTVGAVDEALISKATASMADVVATSGSYQDPYARDRAKIDEVVRIILWAGAPLGEAPNWVSFRPLQDLIPSLSEALAGIVSFLKGLAAAMEDVGAAITKAIEALDQLINYIENIMRMIEAVISAILALSGSFYTIFLAERGVSQFLATAENATVDGKPLPTDRSGFAAGVVFLGNVDPASTLVLQLLFGVG